MWLGLGDRGFEQGKIADARSAAIILDLLLMNLQYFLKRQE
jgi:hypothetical protein